jgi:hypothetical protein
MAAKREALDRLKAGLMNLPESDNDSGELKILN